MGFTTIDYTNPAQFDPLVKALIQRESGWNPRAVSKAGAQGLGQVMPATARDPGFGVAPLADPFDPQANEQFTRQYLTAMLKRTGGAVEPALASYNAGPGNGDKFMSSGGDWSSLPMPQETKPYVTDIMRAYSGNGDYTVSSRNMPLTGERLSGGKYDGGKAGERGGIISQLMSGDVGGAVQNLFTAPDVENPASRESMFSDKAKRMSEISNMIDSQMSNTNAPISWAQVLGSVGSEGVAAYDRGKAEGEAQKVKSQLEELLSSGSMDPKTIAMINSLDPALGRAILMNEDGQRHDVDMQAQRFKDALALQMAEPKEAPDPTALVQNLMAAGFQPGTPEFQTEVMKQLNKVDPGMSAVISPDGGITITNGGSTTSMPSTTPISSSGPSAGGALPGPIEGAAPPQASGVVPPGAVPQATSQPGLTNSTNQGNITGIDKPEDGRIQIVDQNGKLTEQLIPGSKGYDEKMAAEEKKRNENAATKRKATGVIGIIDEARDIVNSDDYFGAAGWSSTGLPSQLTSWIGGSPAKQLRSKLDTIAANIGFDALAQMRQNSPTGGALGNVTERELALLQATIASIDPEAGERVLLEGLNKIEQEYNSILSRLPPEAAAAFSGSTGAAGQSGSTEQTILEPKTQEEIDSYGPGQMYRIDGKVYRID